MNRYIVTGIIFLCTLFEGRAQPNVAAWSQRFDTYQSIWVKTKLHLVFNQDKFSPGDTVWFKAYFLTEDLIGITGKQLINLDLVDSRGKSKIQLLFSVNNGFGQNQFAIPDTLSAGIYLVTAYSNWMRNFEPANIFKKEIVIVRKNTLVPIERPILKVVAEGGHLIGSISNKVSIRTYRAGSSVQIIDALGQELITATADSNGVASMIFTPVRNVMYFARIVGESDQYPLPATEDDGCSLLLIPAKSREEPVKILVTSPSASALRNEELVIILSSRGKICHTTTFVQRTKDVVELHIPQQNLPEGIAHVSLLNHVGTLLASRDFYSPGDEPVQAKIEVTKHYFQTREKVKLEISLTDGNGQPLEGEFAISVLNAGLFDVEKQNSLPDELNIISGGMERFLIDRSDPNWFTSLDNYLISVTEDVPWKKILSGQVTKPPFDFTSVIQKHGRAYMGDTLLPVPDFTQIIFYLQKAMTRTEIITSEKGKFVLTIFHVFGQDEFFYLAQTRGKDIPNLRIEWEDDPLNLPFSSESIATEFPDPYATFTSKSRLIDRSYGFYNASVGTALNNNSLTGNDIEEEIKGPDATVNVQDYIIFPTMEELIKEVIPAIYHRKRGEKSIVRVKFLEPKMAAGDPPYTPGDPIYFIDGIATRNTAFFLSLKPSDLLTMKIVYDPLKLTRFGLMGKNGIVMVQTKRGDVRESFNDPSKLINGLNMSVDFKIRSHSSSDQDQHKPDFRSTIHWNPFVKTDSNGKATIEFFCSDDVSKLSIRIQGLARGGRPFSADKDLNAGVYPEKN